MDNVRAGSMRFSIWSPILIVLNSDTVDNSSSSCQEGEGTPELHLKRRRCDHKAVFIIYQSWRLLLHVACCDRRAQPPLLPAVGLPAIMLEVVSYMKSCAYLKRLIDQ